MNPADPYDAFVERVEAPAHGPGPLAGLRLAVKDNIAVAGLPWTAGLPLLGDRIAGSDAPCVAMLREAGAAVAGTTVTDAAGFGMMTPGVVNPLAPGRTAGGSSGGSAAAVAGGLIDVALGTDTGGSVRVPAACCGIYGLKPSFGRIPIDGVTPLSFTFDHIGLLAAGIDVLDRTARVLLPASRGSLDDIRRIGFDPNRLAGSDDTIRSAVERTLSWLAAQGFALTEIELPDRLALAEMHGAIVCAEALEIWRDHWPRDAARFADAARRSLAYAATLPPDEPASARQSLIEMRAAIGRAFDAADVILGPTIAVPPPRVGARRVALEGEEVPVVFALLAETCPFNVSGHPALSLPLPWPAADGIPTALQIALPQDNELAAIDLARLLSTIPTLA